MTASSRSVSTRSRDLAPSKCLLVPITGFVSHSPSPIAHATGPAFPVVPDEEFPTFLSACRQSLDPQAFETGRASGKSDCNRVRFRAYFFFPCVYYTSICKALTETSFLVPTRHTIQKYKLELIRNLIHNPQNKFFQLLLATFQNDRIMYRI